MVEVQEGGGLVQEENAGLLSQGKCNPDPLAFTPWEAVQEAMPERRW